jgi:ferredoxin
MEVTGVDSILKYNDDESYVYFHKQPEGADETALAEEAAAVCPQNAIGNDGE